jgi:hypothetical protein
MKKYFYVLALFSMVLLVVPVYANTECSGTVTYLGQDGGGTLTVAGPGGLPAVYVCSMTTDGNGWTASTCKVAYATLLAAKLSGQTADIFFNNNTACTSQPAWNTSTLGTVYHVATQ